MDLDTEQPVSATTDTPLAAAPKVDPATLSADQQDALTLVEEICTASGLKAHPEVRSAQKPYISIEIVGEDMHDTWGRSGQSLDALQFLCNTILAHRVEGDVRLLLDADGYRERRADSLRKRAIELANEVKSRNQEAELEPLPAHERRIIHTALADDPEIMTYSEGEDMHRHVVISPRR